MYLLDNLSMHQWYLAQALDVSIRGATSIIGKTGAGKSSLLDAVQVVVSGNNKHVQKLNAAAGDRRERTVRDYCLGCVSDVDGGKPQRGDGIIETTLALCFVDEQTGRTISIGVLIEADSSQPTEDTRRFIAEGYRFRLADFVGKTSDGQEYMASHDTMIATMRRACAPGCFELPQNAKKFVGDYLARMRPGVPPDPERFQRVFANSMLADDVTDPTHFVRRYILDPLPLDIKRVQESIASWRDLEKEVVRIQDMISAIKPVRERYVAGLRQHVLLQTEIFAVAHVRGLLAQDEVESHVGVEKSAQARVDDAANITTRLENVVAMLEEDARSFRAAIASGSTGAEIEATRQDERNAATERRLAVAALRVSVQPYTELGLLENVRDHFSRGDSTTRALQAAVMLRKATQSAGLPDCWCELVPELMSLASQALALTSSLPGLQAQSLGISADIASLADERVEISRQIEACAGSGGMLSSFVTGFVSELNKRGIECMVMAEVVEISDTTWAFALEAVLGAGREAVMVSEKDYPRAHEILYANRSKFSGCRLVDVRKLRPRTNFSVDSIAQIATTSNPVARLYIDSYAGNWTRARDERELALHEHAIMANGKATSGALGRVYRDQPLVLGRVAQASNLDSARNRLLVVVEELTEKRERLDLVDAARQRLTHVQQAPLANIEAAILAVGVANAAADSARERRRLLESQDSDGMAENLRDTENNLRAEQAKLGNHKIAAQKAAIALGIASHHVKASKANMLALHNNEENARNAQNDPRSEQIIGLLECSGDTIATRQARISNQEEFQPINARDRGKYLSGVLDASLKRVTELTTGHEISRITLFKANSMLSDFMRTYMPGEAANTGNDDIEQYRWVVAREKTLVNNELLPHKKDVEKARETMEVSLREDLLTRLSENFDELDRQIRSVNSRLASHTFIGQRYRFSKSLNVRMKPLYSLVRQVAQGTQEQNSLLSRMVEHEDVDVLDMAGARLQIESILSGQDGAVPFDDYREFFEFEMEMISRDKAGVEMPPVSYSKVVGKLSGGQKQAPYYVAIAASMVGAYYPSRGRARAGEEGMGLIMFDEGFSKLDVVNSQALVALFKALGLQILVAATEEKRATVRESVDTLVTVIRRESSRDLFVDSVTIGPRARKAMQEANPAYKIESVMEPVANNVLAESNVDKSMTAPTGLEREQVLFALAELANRNV